MKEIQLTQGKVAMVDDEDFQRVNLFKWNATKYSGGWYARRGMVVNGKNTTILMHRFIMNTPKDMQTDHIDWNGLNCQKHNMRICTKQDNLKNRKTRGKSMFHGVSFFVRGDKKYIKAAIKIDGKYKYLGLFKTETDAAKAYDKEAKEYFKEFAHLNFIHK